MKVFIGLVLILLIFGCFNVDQQSHSKAEDSYDSTDHKVDDSNDSTDHKVDDSIGSADYPFSIGTEWVYNIYHYQSFGQGPPLAPPFMPCNSKGKKQEETLLSRKIRIESLQYVDSSRVLSLKITDNGSHKSCWYDYDKDSADWESFAIDTIFYDTVSRPIIYSNIENIYSGECPQVDTQSVLIGATHFNAVSCNSRKYIFNIGWFRLNRFGFTNTTITDIRILLESIDGIKIDSTLF